MSSVFFNRRQLPLVVILFICEIHRLFPFFTQASHCFGPGLNSLYGDCADDTIKCPWYRNLARQVPMSEGCAVLDLHFRKYGNCVSDKDCCEGSYCCFSICQGITRCYNPYINKYTDNLHNFTGNPPCLITQVPCNDTKVTITITTTTTRRPTTTTTTTTEKPTTITTTTEEPTTTTTTTEEPTTTTTTTTTTKPTTTTTTTEEPTTEPSTISTTEEINSTTEGYNTTTEGFNTTMEETSTTILLTTPEPTTTATTTTTTTTTTLPTTTTPKTTTEDPYGGDIDDTDDGTKKGSEHIVEEPNG